MVKNIHTAGKKKWHRSYQMTFHESPGLAWCRVEQPTFPDCKNDTWTQAETTFRPNPDETLKNSESCPMESVNPRDTAPIQRTSRTRLLGRHQQRTAAMETSVFLQPDARVPRDAMRDQRMGPCLARQT